MRFKHIIIFTFTFLIMGCDGSYQSNKDEMVTELKTYDNDTSSCPSSGCMFVAVEDSGTILASSDGISWTSWTSGTSNNLHGVTYANSTFVEDGDLASNAEGTILTSSSGSSWTSRISGYSRSLYEVIYGNSIFVVAWGRGRRNHPHLF